MANKAQTTKKLLTSKAGKKGIQWTVGQMKKGITWLGGGQGKINRKAIEATAEQAGKLAKTRNATRRATRDLNKEISSVTGRKWTNADWKQTRANKESLPIIGSIGEKMLLRDKMANRLAKQNKLYQQTLGTARRKAADEVFRTGLTRAGIGGAALLAGIPVYNALTDEPEMYDTSNLQAIEPEVIEPETLPGSGAENLIYYARDTDPHWNNGNPIIQNSDGTLFINGQQLDDRDKAAAAAAGFDNVFDYKAARAGLSSREEVAELQRQLGLKPDGLFGINTEKAYYDYMRSNPKEVADKYILPNDGWIQV